MTSVESLRHYDIVWTYSNYTYQGKWMSRLVICGQLRSRLVNSLDPPGTPLSSIASFMYAEKQIHQIISLRYPGLSYLRSSLISRRPFECCPADIIGRCPGLRAITPIEPRCQRGNNPHQSQ
jgi:hypothetical protein